MSTIVLRCKMVYYEEMGAGDEAPPLINHNRQLSVSQPLSKSVSSPAKEE